jgi:C4-dicarboxylate-specific signal transduction histidine kinase
MDDTHEVVLLKANTESINLDGFIIIRDKKGFYNGTAICKKTNKKNKNMWDFLRLPSTVTRLSLLGGREANVYKAVIDGVKVHMISPTIFLHLVQWLDPELDVMVSAWLMKMSQREVELHEESGNRIQDLENNERDLKAQIQELQSERDQLKRKNETLIENACKKIKQ